MQYEFAQTCRQSCIARDASLALHSVPVHHQPCHDLVIHVRKHMSHMRMHQFGQLAVVTRGLIRLCYRLSKFHEHTTLLPCNLVK